ncbi:hypothetical protein [Novosphingobium sp.]|uniref:hypothetical protein n=1 Tax=Novosphingobium sp. TaxID=1874826 RepID=UPI003342BE36
MWQHSANPRKKTLSFRRWSSFVTSAPVFDGLLLLLAAAYFGSSRNLLAFLLSIPVLIYLFLESLIAAMRAAIIKSDHTRMWLAWALIFLAPLAFIYSYKPVQQIRFLLWAPSHYSQLAEASKKDGIVIEWDVWGMAGQETSSYLVVDTEDRLLTKTRADKWAKQIGQSCDFWEGQGVWPKFYIVSTSTDCPYEGF